MNENIPVDIPESRFPRVVIVGGGFGGIALTKSLRSKEVQVLMLDKHNYHTFQPLLYQVATGGLEPDSIAFPLRKIFKGQANFVFRVAEVTEVIPEKNLLYTSIGNISYDYLVLATGSETNFFGLTEIQQNSMPMKSIPEALDLRSMILQNFELALLKDSLNEQEALMNFVVVGGGPTGVETAGALAELKNHVLPNDYPELDIRRMQINLVESSGKLLGAMSPQASESAARFLQEMGVILWLGEQLTSYDGKRALLKSGKELVTANLIWTAGVKGAVIKGINPEIIVRGNRVKVDAFNRIGSSSNIFAIGDMAAMISEEFPNGHPGVAPVAMQQAKQLGKNLVKIMNGIEPEPFRYMDKGTMATIGRNRAVVDLTFIRFQGIFAWFVWMFVHLLTLVGFRNKMVVFVNWVWNYFSYDRGTRLIIRPFRKLTKKEDHPVMP